MNFSEIIKVRFCILALFGNIITQVSFWRPIAPANIGSSRIISHKPYKNTSVLVGTVLNITQTHTLAMFLIKPSKLQIKCCIFGYDPGLTILTVNIKKLTSNIINKSGFRSWMALVSDRATMVQEQEPLQCTSYLPYWQAGQ